jgi:hypothetical protein
MDHISELRKRERGLRNRIQDSGDSEIGVSLCDRGWTVCHLAEMRTILDRHLAELPESKRPYEEYRLEFELPLFNYLSRAYGLFYPESAELMC